MGEYTRHGQLKGLKFSRLTAADRSTPETGNLKLTDWKVKLKIEEFVVNVVN
jgi:hypothetical protein